MKKRVMSAFAVVLAVLIMVNLMVPVFAVDTSSLGSLLDSYQTQNGTFTLNDSSRFYIVSDTEPAGSLLQTVQLVQRQFAADSRPSKKVLPIVWGPADWAKAGDIVVHLNTGSGIGADGYQLNVSSTAKVTASDTDGLLYGLNMLHKYFRNAGSNKLSGFTAEDTPDTKERTVMLDCARKYLTKDWICNFIKEMSWMGYNTLELHFSEDGGFRADFWDPQYYKGSFHPENDFSWICGSHVQSWVGSGYANDPDAGKYLTTAELVEILNTAKEYHIAVIPSFDSPAHMDYLTWKFEQNYKSNSGYSFKSSYDGKTYTASSVNGCINYTEKTGEGSPTWPDYTTIAIKQDVAKAFVFQLYSDIADFFQEYAGSTDFSIGADEVNLSAPDSPNWSYKDFPGYVNDLNRMLNKKGYTCRMFNDFIGSTTYNKSGNQKKYTFASNIEILYWNSPYNPNTGNQSWDSIWAPDFFWDSQYGDGDRILYNCIQTNCYYVLRVADRGISESSSNYRKDARDPSNTNWTFYHSTEENIYNEWYPADISEHGLKSEDAQDVPAANLGGAYFLIWNDYASVSTQDQMWLGAPAAGNSSGTYYLLNRMWSNIIKMWNVHVNDDENNAAVDFSTFKTVRDSLGYFPGYTAPSTAASLPNATNPTKATRADHSALTAALANKISSGGYTADSYAAYEEAYNEAQSVNANDAATEEQLTAALNNLKAAESNLVRVVSPMSVVLKTTVNGEEKIIATKPLDVADGASTFSIYLAPLTGYQYERAEGATFVPLASGDGSGFIRGELNGSATVTVWYKNTPSLARLNSLVAESESSQGSYTDASWTVYQTALTNAKNFTVSDTTTQADVDTVVAALEQARSKLVVASDSTKILEVVKLAASTPVGKQIALKITTTPNVEELSVGDVTMTLCTGKVQTLNTGKTVKIWLVYIPATTAGKYTYTIYAGSASEQVAVTVN